MIRTIPVSALRKFNRQALRDLKEPELVTDAYGNAIVVVVPYATYMRLQDSLEFTLRAINRHDLLEQLQDVLKFKP